MVIQKNSNEDEQLVHYVSEDIYTWIIGHLCTICKIFELFCLFFIKNSTLENPQRHKKEYLKKLEAPEVFLILQGQREQGFMGQKCLGGGGGKAPGWLSG